MKGYESKVPEAVRNENAKKLAEMERDLIRSTLDQCGGNRTRTAQVLGIGVRTLFNKLKVYEEPAVAAQA